MKTTLLAAMTVIVLTGCKNRNTQADAYGNFEATEVIISAETGGKILIFDKEEGLKIQKGELIALIDTTMLDLQRDEILAGMKGVKTKLTSINAQNDILEQQIANQNINVARIEKMLKDDAATRKQYDDITGQVAVLHKQIAANNTQKVSIAAELAVYGSKMAAIDEQLSRSSVRSPLDGTILEKYAEAGEMTAPGKPLAKIADMSVIKLKVYVSGAEIGNVRLGQECSVRIDDGKKGFRNFRGTVSYVSDKAEFTPKIIQTKDERVTLVYAVNIDIVNDGTLKSGMPGEAIF